MTLRFGPFRLERDAYRLLRGAAPVALSPKALDLLFLLVARPQSLVTKDDMLAALWPDVAVTDNAITQVVSDLRSALDDDASAPTYVQTVPRRGYRFIAAVAEEPSAERRPAGPPDRPTPRTVAVLTFANLSGDAETGWLGTGIAAAIAGDLRAIRDLRVVDRALVSATDPTAGAEEVRRTGAALVVAGSYQRSAERLRVTAHVTDVATGETLAHARADGPLTDVFSLQDALIAQLLQGLELAVPSHAAGRQRARETMNLDAYRAATEGLMRLEALDPGEVDAAIGCFERALALDPGYAVAHVGIAHARFWRFQASRAQVRPAVDELAAAVRHAREAIVHHAELAEAHAALAFFLSSADRSAEAVAAGRRAVALEPGNWRHLFRLGVAAWGEERRQALTTVIAHFPQLAYAYVGLAMLDIARGDLHRAGGALVAGLAASATATPESRKRFPASGLYWLLGLVRLAQGETAAATEAFERERQASGSRLFMDEYRMGAGIGLGYVRLRAGDPESATALFAEAAERFPGHPRVLAGLTAALSALGSSDRTAESARQCQVAIAEVERSGRIADAAVADAILSAVLGQDARAISRLDQLLTDAPDGPAGWSVPVEPAFDVLRHRPEFQPITDRLAARAR